MKSFILFAFLLIVSTCEGLNDILIIEQPKVNPNTQLYIEQFEIDMKVKKIFQKLDIIVKMIFTLIMILNLIIQILVLLPRSIPRRKAYWSVLR